MMILVSAPRDHAITQVLKRAAKSSGVADAAECRHWSRGAETDATHWPCLPRTVDPTIGPEACNDGRNIWRQFGDLSLEICQLGRLDQIAARDNDQMRSL